MRQYDDEGIEVQGQAAAGIQTGGEKIGNGKYRVWAKNRRGKMSFYDVRFTFQARPVPEDVESIGRRAVTVSSQPQVENPAANAIDGDLSTRWSAEGKNEWLQLELRQEEAVDGVGIAFMNGDTRTANVEVMLSQDGKEWTTVFSGDTSGRTAQEEYFPADGQRARYIKVYCHGTSVGIWNSILEINAYRKR